jgi:hypothetical protein
MRSAPSRGPSFAATNRALIRAKIGGPIPDVNAPFGKAKVISGLAPGNGEPHEYLPKADVGVVAT